MACLSGTIPNGSISALNGRSEEPSRRGIGVDGDGISALDFACGFDSDMYRAGG